MNNLPNPVCHCEAERRSNLRFRTRSPRRCVLGNSKGILSLALPELNPENTPGASQRPSPALRMGYAEAAEVSSRQGLRKAGFGRPGAATRHRWATAPMCCSCQGVCIAYERGADRREVRHIRRWRRRTGDRCLAGERRATLVTEFGPGTILAPTGRTTHRQGRAAFVTEPGAFTVCMLTLGTLHTALPRTALGNCRRAGDGAGGSVTVGIVDPLYAAHKRHASLLNGHPLSSVL